MRRTNMDNKEQRENEALSQQVLNNLVNDALATIERGGSNSSKSQSRQGNNGRRNSFEEVVTTTVTTTKKTLVDFVNLGHEHGRQVTETEQGTRERHVVKNQQSFNEEDEEGDQMIEDDTHKDSPTDDYILNQLRGVRPDGEAEKGDDLQSYGRAGKSPTAIENKYIEELNGNEYLDRIDEEEDSPRGSQHGVHHAPPPVRSWPKNANEGNVGVPAGLPQVRADENFKTGTFQKDYYSEAFSFSKDHDNTDGTGQEGGGRGLERRDKASANMVDDGSTDIGGANSFQMMKSKNQAAMSTAQIIKYHNFVSKRAKKVFTSLLKGYSPV